MAPRSDAPPPLPAAEPPRNQPRSFWRRPAGVLTICGIAVGAVMFAAIAWVVTKFALGYYPDTRVMAGRDLPDQVVQAFREQGVIEADESISYCYALGLLDYFEDSSLLTDRRVIRCWRAIGEDEQQAGAVESCWYTFDEIADVEVAWGSGMMEDTVVTVRGNDGEEFDLYLATERKGDHEFHSALRARWAAAKPAAESVEPAGEGGGR